MEVYGGGASVLFGIENPKPIEIYNDIEENVYSLMKVLQNEKLFEKFKFMCDVTYHSRQLNKDYRESLREDNLAPIDRAFMFYYLTRTSFNGLGGYSCPLVVRRNMSKGVSDYLSSVDMLEEYHQRLSRVQIENMDGVKLLKKHNTKNVFAYLDPPYALETRSKARYKEDFTNEQQTELIDFLLTTNQKILLSGYRCEEYKRLENAGWKSEDFEVKVTKQGKGTSKIETLWKNYE
jgi:DNA adenine methylase